MSFWRPFFTRSAHWDSRDTQGKAETGGGGEGAGCSTVRNHTCRLLFLNVQTGSARVLLALGLQVVYTANDLHFAFERRGGRCCYAQTVDAC